VHGDGRRPAFLARRVGRGTVLPRVVDTTTLDATLLKTFPLISPENATALARSARSYRDGLWIAETEPALAWLLFVSAIEVAAVQVHIDRTLPEDILRASKLNLVGILERAERGAPERALRGLVRGLQVRTGQRLPTRRAARPGRAMCVFRTDLSARSGRT
jgi:hypothetical protein